MGEDEELGHKYKLDIIYLGHQWEVQANVIFGPRNGGGYEDPQFSMSMGKMSLFSGAHCNSCFQIIQIGFNTYSFMMRESLSVYIYIAALWFKNYLILELQCFARCCVDFWGCCWAETLWSWTKLAYLLDYFWWFELHWLNQTLGHYMYLFGGFKHGLYFPCHMWDIILPIDWLDFPIFQDG